MLILLVFQKQLAPGQTKVLYSLYGVVAHSGTLRYGHYVAYVKVSYNLRYSFKNSIV